MSGRNSRNVLRSVIASQSDLKNMLKGANLSVLLNNQLNFSDEDLAVLNDPNLGLRDYAQAQGDPKKVPLSAVLGRFVDTWGAGDYNNNKKNFFTGTDAETVAARNLIISKLKENGVQLPSVMDNVNNQARNEIARGEAPDPEKDVDVKQDEELGDVVLGDKAAHYNASATLRPSFGLAGSDNLRTTPEQNLQSNALFDAFGWVPRGYGLGENNRLALRNQQNDFMRYGMEDLAQPRSYEYTNMPHHVPQQWYNYRTPDQIGQDFQYQYQKDTLEMQTAARQLANPQSVLHHEYNTMPSSRGLPRRHPSLYVPVSDNIRQFLPTHDYSSSSFNRMSNMRDNVSDSWNYYQNATYSNLL